MSTMRGDGWELSVTQSTTPGKILLKAWWQGLQTTCVLTHRQAAALGHELEHAAVMAARSSDGEAGGGR